MVIAVFPESNILRAASEVKIAHSGNCSRSSDEAEL